MVSRSDTYKTIRRRTGGTGHKPRLTAKEAESGVVGSHKRTRVRDVNRPGDWIPNPKYKPGNPYSGEPPMIRNPERKKDKSRAKISKEAEERKLKAAKTKRRKQLVKETAAKADKGRAARVAESAKARPRGRKEPTVTVTPVGPPEDYKGGRSEVGGKKVGSDWQKRTGTGVRVPREGAQQPIGRTAAAMQAAKQEEIKLTPEQRARLEALQRRRNEDSYATFTGSKKGGTVNKKYGGTPTKKKATNKKKAYKQTKKTYGGHHGSKLVAKLYD